MKPLKGIAGVFLLFFTYSHVVFLIRHLNFPNEPYHGFQIFYLLLHIFVTLFAGVVLLLDARPGRVSNAPK
jgi:hypothetical protein